MGGGGGFARSCDLICYALLNYYWKLDRSGTGAPGPREDTRAVYSMWCFGWMVWESIYMCRLLTASSR